jgi:hypothetical protein
VAANIPAANNTAPLGIKKQKNNPVLAYTSRQIINNPPYLINASMSKMDKKKLNIVRILPGIITAFYRIKIPRFHFIL